MSTIDTRIETAKTELELLKLDAARQIEAAYDRGFNDGIGIKLPTQAEFDAKHREPQPYGEEDNWVVISANLYGDDEALAKIREYCRELDDELPSTVERWNVGYKRYEGEPSYYLNTNEPGIWQVWGVETL